MQATVRETTVLQQFWSHVREQLPDQHKYLQPGSGYAIISLLL